MCLKQLKQLNVTSKHTINTINIINIATKNIQVVYINLHTKNLPTLQNNTMSLLDDENILIDDIQKITHPLNVLQSFISYNDSNYGFYYSIDLPTFRDIYPILNQIWNVGDNTLFEWKISRYGVFYLDYMDPKYDNYTAEICRIEFLNYRKFNEIQTVVRMASPNDPTYYGYLYGQREELYDTIKYFQDKIIKKNKLRKKGENLYIL